jgi:hypothetical protein
MRADTVAKAIGTQTFRARVSLRVAGLWKRRLQKPYLSTMSCRRGAVGAAVLQPEACCHAATREASLTVAPAVERGKLQIRKEFRRDSCVMNQHQSVLLGSTRVVGVLTWVTLATGSAAHVQPVGASGKR